MIGYVFDKLSILHMNILPFPDMVGGGAWGAGEGGRGSLRVCRSRVALHRLLIGPASSCQDPSLFWIFQRGLGAGLSVREVVRLQLDVHLGGEVVGGVGLELKKNGADRWLC